MKPKLKQVIAKPNNTSIIIYYSYNGEELRFPTGVKISNKKYSSGKFADWDYSRNAVKSNIVGYEAINEKIQATVNKANSILGEYFKKNITPTPSQLEKLLLSNEQTLIANSTSLITDLFSKFHQAKNEQFTATNTLASLKDFTSTKNLIADFETYKEVAYQVHQFDLLWCRDILNFMRLPHKNEPDKNKFYTTFGSLAGKTARKRFDIIIQFADYLKDSKIINYDLVDSIKNFRRKEIKVPKSEKTTLTIEEVIKLYDHKFDILKHDQIKDTFVFICLTGLRYSDYLLFDKKFIRKSSKSDDLIYEKKAQKTKGSSGLNYKIPLCDIAIEILKKYDYKLPDLANPNELIKAALVEANLFNEPTQKIDKITGKEKMRFECISMHKGRDTFITNLVDVTPLNQLMKYTGHSKLSTLQGYIDTSREVDTNPIKNFNRK